MGAQWKIVEKTPTVFLEGQCHIYDCCSINGKQLEDLSQTDKQKNLLCSAPVGALNTQLALKFPVQIPSIKYQKLEEGLYEYQIQTSFYGATNQKNPEKRAGKI